MLRFNFTSIQARLLAAFLLVILVIIGLAGLITNRIFTDYFQQNEDRQMAERTRVVAAMVSDVQLFRTVADLQAVQGQMERAAGVKLNILTGVDDIQATLPDGGRLRLLYPFRQVVPFVRNGRVLAVVVIEPVPGFNPARQDMARGLLRLGGVGLAVSALLALWLSRSLSLPLQQLTRAASALGAGKLDHKLPESRQDELGVLARNFNRMSDSLQASFRLIEAERDRLKEFIAEMSHELRTPLTALSTFNELLLEGADTDPAVRRDFLLNGRQQILRMRQLTENLLQLSRLDSGLIQLQLVPADLRQVAEDALHRLEVTATIKGVTLHSQWPEGPVPIRCDADRLGQALDNLISNGIKYAPAGGAVYLTIATEDDQAVLRVADTGPGIAPADVPKLFQRFYRGQIQNTDETGSGLGLAIVQKVVEAHGGEVAVTDPARAEFTVRLPLNGTGGAESGPEKTS